MEIYKSLLEAKKEIGKVSKNAKNPHFKNTYADINALIEAVEPILLSHGLILIQPITENKVVTRLIHAESGTELTSEIDLPIGSNPQQLGSAITYYRRYTLQSLLSLQAEDDDGQKASNTKSTLPTFTEANFEKAKQNGATVDQIKKYYTLSLEIENQYNEYIK
jgi:hypothetical protein